MPCVQFSAWLTRIKRRFAKLDSPIPLRPSYNLINLKKIRGLLAALKPARPFWERLDIKIWRNSNDSFFSCGDGGEEKLEWDNLAWKSPATTDYFCSGLNKGRQSESHSVEITAFAISVFFMSRLNLKHQCCQMKMTLCLLNLQLSFFWQK